MVPFRLILIASVFVLTGCGQRSEDFYVITDDERADAFASELASIARQRDFAAYALQATDDRGRTLHVVEGHRGLARLWAQNMPMSSLADERCKKFGDAVVDPRQFIISVSRRFWVFGSSAVGRAKTDLRSGLAAKGYQVRDAPVACSLILDS